MAANKTAFLDVDPKILENNFTFEECKPDLEDYKTLLGINDDGNTPWKLVTPKPGFCVKTVDDKRNKVFVNFCTLNEIPEPRDVNEDELIELLERQDPNEFRIPLSLQEPREELDKSGKPSICYDVAINTKFYQKIITNEVFKMFLLQATFDGLKDKFDVDLEIEDYVILKNRKCVGTLRPHRIRTTPISRPPTQLIQELPTGTHVKAAPITKPGIVRHDNSQLDYRLSRIVKDGKDYLYGQVHLPGAVWGKNVNLEVGEDRIVVESRRAGHLLDVFLPFVLDANHVKAEFSTSSRILHFVSPIVKSEGVK